MAHPEKKYTNRLVHASSPYLLQHAHNPVDWYEWGEEAFEKARTENRLMLISIGYSACHWCHVMERETFENENTAILMNNHFVCIKVDREERPDVDQIYMDAVQLITGRGGWPLNVFTLPDGRPIHGGTYFPNNDWNQLLFQLADLWHKKPDEAAEYAEKLTQGVRSMDIRKELLPEQKSADLAEIFTGFQATFDWQNGGYNRAPKFPMPNTYHFLLHYHHFRQEEQAMQFTNLTLVKMALGGIYDHLGGGFARYAVDETWLVPHFEKMLYDNAQLVSLYAETFHKTGTKLYRQVLQETMDFVLRELTHDNGAFYSALDADSEGVEGKFYTFTQDEINEVLGDKAALFSAFYGVTKEGNWEHVNILHIRALVDKIAGDFGVDKVKVMEVLTESRMLLFNYRAKRIRPGLDDKAIASWNGLMLQACADAYRVTGDARYLDAAHRNAQFIRRHLWLNGRLHRIFKDGKTTITGFAEDYAAVIQGLVALHQADQDEQHLLLAYDMMQVCLRDYLDAERKLFYFTSAEDAPLIVRKTDTADDVIPSANSMLARQLIHLGHLFGKPEWIQLAGDMLHVMQEQFVKYPGWYGNWADVELLRQRGLIQVVISGPEAEAFIRQLSGHYLPNVLLVQAKEGSRLPICEGRIHTGESLVYVCQDMTCQLPVKSLAEVFPLLG